MKPGHGAPELEDCQEERSTATCSLHVFVLKWYGLATKHVPDELGNDGQCTGSLWAQAMACALLIVRQQRCPDTKSWSLELVTTDSWGRGNGCAPSHLLAARELIGRCSRPCARPGYLPAALESSGNHIINHYNPLRQAQVQSVASGQSAILCTRRTSSQPSL